MDSKPFETELSLFASHSKAWMKGYGYGIAHIEENGALLVFGPVTDDPRPMVKVRYNSPPARKMIRFEYSIKGVGIKLDSGWFEYDSNKFDILLQKFTIYCAGSVLVSVLNEFLHLARK